MRFSSAALFLSLSLASISAFADEGHDGGDAAPAPKSAPKKKVNINMPGGRMAGGGFPLHIFISTSQSIGSGTFAGIQKDPNAKNYEVYNETGDIQPLNAYTATSIFLQPMANYKGFSLASSMWYTFEETPTDNPSGRQVTYGDPYTSLAYIFRIKELNLMFRPSAGFTVPLSERSRYLTRIGGAVGGSMNWFYKTFSIGGNAMLRYNHDFFLNSPANQNAKAYQDRTLGAVTPIMAALRTGQDATALLGNTSGPSTSMGINLSYNFLEKFTVSANLQFMTALRNPLADDEFTAPQAAGGTTLPMVLGRTSTAFNLQGTYQMLSWLGIYAAYSAQQPLFTFAGRGFEPLDYEEYESGSKQSTWTPSTLLFDYTNFSQNTMALSAGLNIFY